MRVALKLMLYPKGYFQVHVSTKIMKMDESFDEHLNERITELVLELTTSFFACSEEGSNNKVCMIILHHLLNPSFGQYL